MYTFSGFIPADLTVDSWDDLKPYFSDLATRNPQSAEDLAELVVHYSEALSVFHENNAWAYINMTRETDNADYLKRHELFSTVITPEIEEAANAIDKKIASHAAFNDLDAQRYAMLKRSLERELQIFRIENVPLQAEISKLSTRYDQLTGGLTVTLDGEEMPMPKAGARLQDSDRGVRKEAWQAMMGARYAIKADADKIYDDMLKLRNQVAINAGYTNFRDYQHDRLQRFDYTPDDAVAFQESIAQFVVPLARDIHESHRKRLGLAEDDFRPWDLEGQPKGMKPLKPFENGTDLLANAISIFQKLHPEFGANLKAMQASDLFDLDSRKGKAPGGYNYGLEVTGMPFIFMNAAGTQRDVVTMVHEGGHAMHTFLTNDEPLIQYRDTPAEMAETASMSMELLTADLWTAFYGAEDHRRARREHLEGIIKFFPWCATVDAFQHWVYLNPEHTSSERDDFFLSLTQRFGPGNVNWTGYEKFERNAWQRQLHIFGVPFYYIEYGIAQLGALQVYRNYKQDPKKALEAYRAGLALGNSRPMPEVWKTMNISFDFSAATIKDLMAFVQQELEALND